MTVQRQETNKYGWDSTLTLATGFNPTKAPSTATAPVASPKRILSRTLLALPHVANMSSAAPKDDTHPAVKGPSALRSIIAGSTAGAVEIGEHTTAGLTPGMTWKADSLLFPSYHIPGRV